MSKWGVKGANAVDRRSRFRDIARRFIGAITVGYPSGQRGQTVNLLAYAFAGSNPAPTTTLHIQRGTAV